MLIERFIYAVIGLLALVGYGQALVLIAAPASQSAVMEPMVPPLRAAAAPPATMAGEPAEPLEPVTGPSETNAAMVRAMAPVPAGSADDAEETAVTAGQLSGGQPVEPAAPAASDGPDDGPNGQDDRAEGPEPSPSMAVDEPSMVSAPEPQPEPVAAAPEPVTEQPITDEYASVEAGEPTADTSRSEMNAPAQAAEPEVAALPADEPDVVSASSAEPDLEQAASLVSGAEDTESGMPAETMDETAAAVAPPTPKPSPAPAAEEGAMAQASMPDMAGDDAPMSMEPDNATTDEAAEPSISEPMGSEPAVEMTTAPEAPADEMAESPAMASEEPSIQAEPVQEMDDAVAAGGAEPVPAAAEEAVPPGPGTPSDDADVPAMAESPAGISDAGPGTATETPASDPTPAEPVQSQALDEASSESAADGTAERSIQPGTGTEAVPQEPNLSAIESLPPPAAPVDVASFAPEAAYPLASWTILGDQTTGRIETAAVDGDEDRTALRNEDILVLSGWAGDPTIGVRVNHVVFSLCGEVVGTTAVSAPRADIADEVHPNLANAGWGARLGVAHLPRCETPNLTAWAVNRTSTGLFPLAGQVALDLPAANADAVDGFNGAPPLRPGDQADARAVDLAVQANSLRVRSGPGTNFRTLGSLRRGTYDGFVTEEAEGWVQIILPQIAGWVSGDFVDLR